MRRMIAGLLVFVGVVLFIAQWMVRNYTDPPAAELYAFREYSKTTHVPTRGSINMSEAEFNRHMSQFVAEALDDLYRSRNATTKQALLGVCGGVCMGVGVFLFSREQRRRRLAQTVG